MENYENKPVVSTEELMADSKQSYPHQYQHPMVTNAYPPNGWCSNQLMALQIENLLLWQRLSYQSFYGNFPTCENFTPTMDATDTNTGTSNGLIIKQEYNIDPRLEIYMQQETDPKLETARKHKRKISADILALIDARSETQFNTGIENEPGFEMDNQPDSNTTPNVEMKIEMEDKSEFQPETGVLDDVKKVLDLELINPEMTGSISAKKRIGNRITVSKRMLDRFLAHGNPKMARKFMIDHSKNSEQRKKNNLTSRISRSKDIIAKGLVEVKTHNLCVRKKELREWIKRLSEQS